MERIYRQKKQTSEFVIDNGLIRAINVYYNQYTTGWKKGHNAVLRPR